MIYVVDKSGAGDFTGIQQAIDALPSGAGAPTTIVLRNDEYKESVCVNKSNMRIVGEARERVLFNMAENAQIRISGDNVEIDNISFINASGEFINVKGDNFQARNCYVNGAEDSLGGILSEHKPIAYIAGDFDISSIPPKAISASIIDCTVSGCSAKSYVAEKRLAMIELCLLDGDYVLVGFGDGNSNPNLQYFTEAEIIYPEYLAMFVYASRDRCATPMFIVKNDKSLYENAMCSLAETMGVKVLEAL